MRRLVVLCTLLALFVPVTAGASTRAAGDGTLSVNDLVGVPSGVSLSIRVTQQAGLIGRCDQCAFRLDELAVTDGTSSLVTGADRRFDVDGDGEHEYFSGRDVRWKIVGGGYRLRIRQGRDIDLTVVGKARVLLRGTEGTYAVNEGAEKFVSPEFALILVGTPPPPATP
jgi:hypothetical protein